MANKKAMLRCSRCRQTKDTDYFTRLSLITDKIKTFKSCNACAKYRFIYRNQKTAKKSRSTRIECECGCMITKAHISTHRRTKKHLRLISKQ